jgi:hypothetical protein
MKEGGKVLSIAHHSMVINGTIAEWERWANMCFSASGQYVVAGALKPVTIDLEEGRGSYEEPNMWMLHKTT